MARSSLSLSPPAFRSDKIALASPLRATGPRAATARGSVARRRANTTRRQLLARARSAPLDARRRRRRARGYAARSVARYGQLVIFDPAWVMQSAAAVRQRAPVVIGGAGTPRRGAVRRRRWRDERFDITKVAIATRNIRCTRAASRSSCRTRSATRCYLHRGGGGETGF